MKFSVEIMPRPEALDPQGRAVHSALSRLGFKISDCRVGKRVVVDVEALSKEAGEKLAKEMADKLLANPLIEVYEVKAL